jgi:Bacterial membrane protein YfhO
MTRLRVLAVVAGLVLGQFALYWPSLLGQKILLPLDYLAHKSVYLPQTPEIARIQPQSPFVMDLVLLFEPARRFAVSELQAGRLPMWNPYEYAGAPFIWPKFSPFLAFECLTASPVIVAWGQMLAAIAAGLGAYFFFRRVAAVSFWPAAFAAWSYPMTAFFIYWLGFPTSLSVYWLPWELLAVHNVTKSPQARSIAALAVVTSLVLISGHPDLAGQVLIISGFYALWRLWIGRSDQSLPGRPGNSDVSTTENGTNRSGPMPDLDTTRGRAVPAQSSYALVKRTSIALAIGWFLGFMLAAPHILPLLDYAHTGARILERGRGVEERPPTGLAALPEVLLPDFYGTNKPGESLRYFDQNQFESAGAAYTGLLATMVLAPLAWRRKEQRNLNSFFAGIFAFGLAWCLNVPVIVQILRLPGLNMLSHNRWVFASSFAILTLAASGLEAVRAGNIQLRRWDWLVPALTSGLGAWCLYRSSFLPEPIASQLEQSVRSGNETFWVEKLSDVRVLQSWFSRYYLEAAAGCFLAIGVWLALRFRQAWQPRLFPVLGLLVVGDLLWFAHGRNPQCDRSLYYPPLPALQEISRSGPGRIIGHDCLPPGLASVWGISDIRGYDSIDPGRMVQLLRLTKAPDAPEIPYAVLQWLVPKTTLMPDGTVRLSPILDMLGVRYIITRVAPAASVKVAFHDLDYWVIANSRALPRAFVPRRVEVVEDDQSRLLKLTAPDFDPRAVAYVESPVELPPVCRGSAEITNENPTSVTLSVQMETPGLVALTDLWDKGWRAYRNGQRIPILQTNHAVRGVLMPTGNATVEFRYEPATFRIGLVLASAGALAVAVLLILGRMESRL